MPATVVTLVALVLTLALPIYPTGVTVEIATFLALACAAALFGLRARAARHELFVLGPWVLAIAVGILVGSLSHGDTTQSIEDALPYFLFAMGVVAGRGTRHPLLLLRTVVFLALADSVLSIWMMPSFDPGMRSSFNYERITAGLPLVGLFVAPFVRGIEIPRNGRLQLARHVAIMFVLFAGLILSITRGMILGWLVGATVSLYIRRPSRLLFMSIIAGVLVVAYSATIAELGGTWLRFEQGGTIDERLVEVEVALRTFSENPILGAGLGAHLENSPFSKAYLHNVIAYHLWKFGLLGSIVLALPLVVIARQVWKSPPAHRAHALGGAVGLALYLVTCAAYKTYYAVWIFGVVVGAILTALAAERRQAGRDATT